MEPSLDHFAYAHLPPHLQDASRPFGELARTLFDTLDPCVERGVALRKLLEAKDAAVRAAIFTLSTRHAFAGPAIARPGGPAVAIFDKPAEGES